MRRILFFVFFICTTCMAYAGKPTTVIITAGQSNTDGRIPNAELPSYILRYAPDAQYRHCKISKGSTREQVDGGFTAFRPTINNQNNPNRWAYDAVTYYWLEQALLEDFYVIKWSLGGTAIDTAATSNSRYYWLADPAWLSRTSSTMSGGNSLLLSFEENISTCIDNTLSKLENGYEISAFLWHQGEGDRHQGDHYYSNLKKVVTHVRSFLVEKTGDKKYAELPFICGTVSRFSRQYSDKVETALYQLATEDKHFYVIDMSRGELQKDRLHFTASAGEHLGIEMYNKLVELGVAGEDARQVNVREFVPDWNSLEVFTKDTTFQKAVEPKTGAEELKRLSDLYNDKKSWETRRNRIEEGIRQALLLPSKKMQPETPNSLITGRMEKGGYTVENLAIEVLPCVWVTGNLYRPLNELSAKLPVILSAQGHGAIEPSERNARFNKSSQTMCATLAKMGAIVYNYDMFGIGESGLHTGHDIHRTGLAQSIQTITTMRIIDYFVSLHDADKKAIGITGASGGGTQTFLATALDKRIAVSVPVVQVSCFFPGGCPCESGRPIHLKCKPITNNAEITAMTAPRPLLIVSDGGDWTRTVDKVEFPFIQQIYSYYEKADLVENVHLPDEKHDYGYNKRKAMYDFMAKHLGLDNRKMRNGEGEYDESVIESVEWKKLLVFPDKKLPDGYLNSAQAIYETLLKYH